MYILSNNIVICNGFRKSLIIDFYRYNIHMIPNDFYNFLVQIKKKEINFNNLSDIEQTYFDFCLVNEYLLSVPNKLKNNFKTKEINYILPNLITNSIIELRSFDKIDILLLSLESLAKLDVLFIEIRIYALNNIKELYDLSNIPILDKFDFVELYINVQFDLSTDDFKNWADKELEKYNTHFKIWLFFEDVSNSEILGSNYESNVVTGSINPLSCGKVSKNYFTMHHEAVKESLHHNSCLNRKISIDAEGNIKNCPSMSKSYGNIKDTPLAEAVEKPGFKKYWNINKDKIAVCKDCEFRYICTDCRAYVEDPQDASGPEGTNLSKPLKCGYNPYTGEWSEWSTNPLKQKAIDFYGMREMVEGIKEI